MAIQQSIGKLELSATVSEIMDDRGNLDFGILPILGRHLERLRDLPFVHRDPFDRLLVCQALAENMAIVTADASISRYSVTIVW